MPRLAQKFRRHCNDADGGNSAAFARDSLTPMQWRHILFETARFNCSEVKEHFINDCCFGEDLAAWLKSRLSARDVQAGEPYQEDWGWEFSVRDSAGSYYIGVGGNPMENGSDKNHGEWRLMISKRRSLWEKLTGKNKMSTSEPIVACIQAILGTEPDFSNIHEEQP